MLQQMHQHNSYPTRYWKHIHRCIAIYQLWRFFSPRFYPLNILDVSRTDTFLCFMRAKRHHKSIFIPQLFCWQRILRLFPRYSCHIAQLNNMDNPLYILLRFCSVLLFPRMCLSFNRAGINRIEINKCKRRKIK